MSFEPKRTFIPPENRPNIRGAELRSGVHARHYLAIFNHPARRLLFLEEQTRQPTFETTEVFGIHRDEWLLLIKALRGDQ